MKRRARCSSLRAATAEPGRVCMLVHQALRGVDTWRQHLRLCECILHGEHAGDLHSVAEQPGAVHRSVHDIGLWQGWWIMHAYGCGAPNASAHCRTARARRTWRGISCASRCGRRLGAPSPRLAGCRRRTPLALRTGPCTGGNVDACVAQVLEGLRAAWLRQHQRGMGLVQGALVGQSACSQLVA